MLQWIKEVSCDNYVVWYLDNAWIDDIVKVVEKVKKDGRVKYIFEDFEGKKHKFWSKDEAFLFAIEAAVSRMIDICC